MSGDLRHEHSSGLVYGLRFTVALCTIMATGLEVKNNTAPAALAASFHQICHHHYGRRQRKLHAVDEGKLCGQCYVWGWRREAEVQAADIEGQSRHRMSCWAMHQKPGEARQDSGIDPWVGINKEWKIGADWRTKELTAATTNIIVGEGKEEGESKWVH